MSERFHCPSCQKDYRWKPELAGKRAKCKCGETFEVPLVALAAEPQAPSEDQGLYDFAEPAPAPPLPASPMIPMASVATMQAPARARAPQTFPQTLSYGVPGIVARRRSCCQRCGADAPVKFVEFHQNIGALVIRFHSSVKGELCKS